MGLFTRIFASTKKAIIPAEEKDITLASLPEWLENKKVEILSNSNLGEETLRYKTAIKERRWMLENLLDSWEQKNQSGPVKNSPRQIVGVFLETRKVLENIKFNEQNTTTLNHILSVNANMEKNLFPLLNRLENGNFEEFSVLLEAGKGFNEHNPDHNPLLRFLMDLKYLQEEFDTKVIQSGFKTLGQLQDRAKLLQEKRSEMDEIKKTIETKKTRLNTEEVRKKEKEAELKSLEEGPQFFGWKQSEGKKESLLAELKSTESKIMAYLEPLLPVMKDYITVVKGVGNSVLIQEYMKSPLDAFYGDRRVAIRSIVFDLKKALSTNLFRYDGEEVSRLLVHLSSVPDSFLEQARHNLSVLKQELIESRSSLEHSPLMAKKEDILYRYEHFSHQADKLQHQIQDLEGEYHDDEITFNQQLMLFQKSIENALGISLQIEESLAAFSSSVGFNLAKEKRS